MIRYAWPVIFGCFYILSFTQNAVDAAPVPMPMDGGYDPIRIPGVHPGFLSPVIHDAIAAELQEKLSNLGMSPLVFPYVIAENEQVRAASFVYGLLREHQYVKNLLYLGSDPDGSRYAFVVPDSQAARSLVGHTNTNQARMALVTINHTMLENSHRVNRVQLNGFVAVHNIASVGDLHQRILGAETPSAFLHDLFNLLSGRIMGH
ncbi:hypothetical protein NDA16_002405 [Ustilago loliicola]|nr:hypothetical protein NDA16_002405 [Ustilago loliicola]